MQMNITIQIGSLSMQAALNDTPAAGKVMAALPIRASFSTWGDEIYFPIPVDAELDDSARQVVEIGDLGYWPPGKACCIFFGQTPVSKAGEIRPASAVNIIGRVVEDATRFKEVMRERAVELKLLSRPGR